MAENPPAFPRDERYIGHNGMTLRDWFAGQALAGFIANTKRPTTMARDDATWCYQIADAMLAARAAKAIEPFSTYPEDRDKLLALARKCEVSDDANAVELGDLVRAILEDEVVAEGLNS